MDPRIFVWGQVFAAKLSIHGLSVAEAATDADQALIEFDKRNFVDRDAVIVRLEGELDAARDQNEKDTALLLAAQGESAKLVQAIAEIALPGESVLEVVERLIKALA